jgi:polo-like kinase 1
VDEPSQDALSPPPEDQMKKDQRPPGTLETMHDVLAKTCGGLDDDYYGSNGALLSDIDRKSKAKVPRRSAAQDSADVWVVRYVDYTSKYGLGFLLNTGSAGVYFNDSTKIVLSPDGKVFQYIERKKKVDGVQLIGADHTIQTHLLTRYPAELNKKVTLLCHFRNYLVDQHKSNMHEEQPVAQLDNFTISSKNAQSGGSSSHLKFGQSSVRYIGPSPGATEETSSCYVPIENMEQSNENEMELPFLKKWVRTRHAILFRLSNRTVQVVFFDRSEILLSSEARIVTYVSKAGDRSEHSLEEVLQHGRKDISKRLKYTKDIMYRLINIQTR